MGPDVLGHRLMGRPFGATPFRWWACERAPQERRVLFMASGFGKYLRMLLVGSLVFGGVMVASVVGGSLPASASGSLSCDSVHGHGSNPMVLYFSGCSGPKHATGSFLENNSNQTFTITWAHNGGTTTTGTNQGEENPGPNQCGTHGKSAHELWDWVILPVTGGTSNYTQAGDTIEFTLCGSPYSASRWRELSGTDLSL